jgi:hypothetical protein
MYTGDKGTKAQRHRGTEAQRHRVKIKILPTVSFGNYNFFLETLKP